MPEAIKIIRPEIRECSCTEELCLCLTCERKIDWCEEQGLKASKQCYYHKMKNICRSPVHKCSGYTTENQWKHKKVLRDRKK
jgi:hypothetical protein